jgi:hypothetical protein
MHITLIKPGEEMTASVVNLDFAGDGIVLESTGTQAPYPHYLDNNQEAKEFMIKSTFALLNLGYRIYTGDGVTE